MRRLVKMTSSKKDEDYLKELLTCSVCLQLVREPYTLNQCLHNYCKHCVKKLMKTQTNQKDGILCPLCRKFSATDDIKENHFVKELVALHRKAQDKEVIFITCEKCEAPKPAELANWRCVDCRSFMCHTCKSDHSRFIKGHRMIELTKETKLTIDRQLFCETHPEEPLKFYCHHCKQILCITCHVVNHKNHDTVTIEDALKQMLPQMQSFIDNLHSKQLMLQEGKENLEKKKLHIMELLRSEQEDIDRKANERIKEIRKEQHRMKGQLTMNADIQVKDILCRTEELTVRQREIMNVRNVAQVTVDRAQHLSLLSEFVESGLYEKVEKVAKEKLPNMEVTLFYPDIIFNDYEWKRLLQNGLLGRITSTAEKRET